MPLINCEVELILTWSKICALADMTVRAAGNDNNPPAIVAPTGLEFQITDTKLYVLVVTLSKEKDKKLLEQLKSGFKRTTKRNKYRPQMTIQNNNLNYLIDPTFIKVNRLFVLSFGRIARENNAAKYQRDSFSHYYVPSVEIKVLKFQLMEKVSLTCQQKVEKKLKKKLLRLMEIKTTKLVISWILLISKKITD